MQLALVLALVASGGKPIPFPVGPTELGYRDRAGTLVEYITSGQPMASLRVMVPAKDGGLGDHHAYELDGEPDGGWSFGCAPGYLNDLAFFDTVEHRWIRWRQVFSICGRGPRKDCLISDSSVLETLNCAQPLIPPRYFPRATAEGQNYCGMGGSTFITP